MPPKTNTLVMMSQAIACAGYLFRLRIREGRPRARASRGDSLPEEVGDVPAQLSTNYELFRITCRTQRLGNATFMCRAVTRFSF